MPRLLALEWDAREARVAVARTRGTDVVVEHAFAVDLEPRDPGQTFADSSVGQRVAAALAARNIGRTDTLVAVGRTSIELRQLTLPPAPPEELPEMVRLQALRQFTTITDEWPIDFVPLQSSDSESMNVIAAAIAPELVEQIRGTCQAGDLTPRRLVLRPFAAASLLRHETGEGEQPPCRLMVDLLADEADLTVMVDNQVVFMRTVRLASGDDVAVQTRALLGEIRRTVAAAHNQLRGRGVERIVLCGDGSDQSSLKTALQEELTYEVDLFDPFSVVRVGRELAAQRPAHPGRFAPLLGMLLDEASGAAHAIDFLHPRQKPAPPNQLRRSLLIAATVVVACAAVVFGVLMNLAALDREIQQLSARSQGMKNQLATAERARRDVETIEGFLRSDYTWLDEFYGLSETLPAAEKIIVTQLSMSNRSPAGGQIIVEGYAGEMSHIAEVQAALRGDGRQVVTQGGQDEQQREKYNWRFKETVVLEPHQTLTAAPPADRGAEQPPSRTEGTSP